MRTRRLYIAALVTVAATVAAAIGAGAQVPTVPTVPTTTSTTRPPTSTTSTTRPPGTTTTVPPGGGGGGGGGQTTVPPGGGDGPTTGGDSATPGRGVVPPEAQAQMDAVKRSGSNNTSRLLDALRPLQDLGFTEEEAIAAGFGQFPVAGYATWSHDWLYPRFVPSFHMHEGTDVFAEMGTPVRAPVDGKVRITNGAIGGLAVYVIEPDGTYYYMSHLNGIADGLVEGKAVKVGDIVGFVGDSGNAKGGAPHIHLEIHPQGGGPIDPKGILDSWVAQATAAAPALIGKHLQSLPRAVVTTAVTRRLADGGSGAATSPGPARSQLLWASAANPGGGPLLLAEAEVAGAARRLDWDEVARQQEADALAWKADREAARRLIEPFTPPGVLDLFTG